MKKIVLVGLAASVPALAADRAAVPEIRRAPGGAPPAATRTELKDAGAAKLRTPGAEIKRAELKAGYGELKSPAGRELKGTSEFKAPSEHKAPAEFKFRGDAAAPETAPVQREAPVRY